MRKSVYHALLIGLCSTLGVMSGCGKKEMPPEPGVGYATSVGDVPKGEPTLVGETANCKVYRIADRTSQFTRNIYLSECNNITSSGIAAP